MNSISCCLLKKNLAFTLLELTVTVIILAILASIAIPIYTSAIENAYDKEAFAALQTLAVAESAYFNYFGTYYPSPSGTQLDLNAINTALNTKVETSKNWNYLVVSNGNTCQIIANRVGKNKSWAVTVENGGLPTAPALRDVF